MKFFNISIIQNLGTSKILIKMLIPHNQDVVQGLDVVINDIFLFSKIIKGQVMSPKLVS